MPENDDKNVDDQKVESNDKSKVEEEISEKLGNLLEHNEGDKKLLSMLIADPRVRQIIEADGTGKKLVLIDEAKAKAKPSAMASEEVEESVDLEGLSRADFAKVLLKQLGGVVTETIKSSLSDLSKDVGELNKYVSTQQNARAVVGLSINTQGEYTKGRKTATETMARNRGAGDRMSRRAHRLRRRY